MNISFHPKTMRQMHEIFEGKNTKLRYDEMNGFLRNRGLYIQPLFTINSNLTKTSRIHCTIDMAYIMNSSPDGILLLTYKLVWLFQRPLHANVVLEVLLPRGA